MHLDIVGDLINSVQKFTDLVGWKEDMKELITKEEGRFVLVCTGGVRIFAVKLHWTTVVLIQMN